MSLSIPHSSAIHGQIFRGRSYVKSIGTLLNKKGCKIKKTKQELENTNLSVIFLFLNYFLSICLKIGLDWIADINKKNFLDIFRLEFDGQDVSVYFKPTKRLSDAVLNVSFIAFRLATHDTILSDAAKRDGAALSLILLHLHMIKISPRNRTVWPLSLELMRWGLCLAIPLRLRPASFSSSRTAGKFDRVRCRQWFSAGQQNRIMCHQLYWFLLDCMTVG